MKSLSCLVSALCLAFSVAMSTQAVAQQNPVVVELFTSQGCSSCPPADEFLTKLAERDDVIALALHVDYWDYIGWKDVYANPDYARRQRLYAQSAHRRVVYTPQMIVNGQEDVVGTHILELTDLIAAHKAIPPTVRIQATRTGSNLELRVKNIDGARHKGPLVVQLVRYTPQQETEITRGENAGKRLLYSNVVDEWTVLGRWNGTAEGRFSAQLSDDRPAVVIVQYKGPGAIVAAARVD